MEDKETEIFGRGKKDFWVLLKIMPAPILLASMPCVITHILGADPLGNPATVSRYAGLRSVVLRPTLLNGLPLSNGKLMNYWKLFRALLPGIAL